MQYYHVIMRTPMENNEMHFAILYHLLHSLTGLPFASDKYWSATRGMMHVNNINTMKDQDFDN